MFANDQNARHKPFTVYCVLQYLNEDVLFEKQIESIANNGSNYAKKL